MNREFDCMECGQHVVVFGSDDGINLCGFCLHLPGWFRYPEIREMLAPDGLPNLPDNEK